MATDATVSDSKAKPLHGVCLLQIEENKYVVLFRFLLLSALFVILDFELAKRLGCVHK